LIDMLAPAYRRLGALLAFGLMVLACAPPAAVGAQTVVSLTFDDGTKSQYDVARPQLLAHGMPGTFFINSGNVGANSYFMTWSQIDQLNSDGNEIAGHTIHDRNLDPPPGDPTRPSDEEVRSEICDDAATLRGHGYDVVNFAYPHGRGFQRSAVLAALQDCGYVSGRTFGGLRDDWDCTSCPYLEAIPPEQSYRVRTGGWKPTPYSLDDLKTWVRRAMENGGGWVPIVFHDIDYGGRDAGVTPDDFTAFLDWLQCSGAVVRTVRSVMTVPASSPASTPATCEPPLPVHAFEASAPPPDTATAFASLEVRKRQDVDHIYVTAAMIEPGTLSARGTVVVPGAARVFRLKGRFANAAPGKRVKLRLKLKRKPRRVAKRAIHSNRRVRASIAITATDRAGNKRTAKRAIRLTD
jgi:peptidoglycan/xylan/chitin deacetylase (PgdA/CDA1 family)